MKKTALLVVGAAALALAATALAKEIGSLKVCGAGGCNTTTDRDQLKAWLEGNGNPVGQSSVAGQRYYTIELGFTESDGKIIHRELAYWLPDSKLMRFKGQAADPWWQVSAPQTALYKKVAGGIEAFTPQLSRVTVRSKAAADPSSYLRLFGDFPARAMPGKKLHYVPIRLTASTPNPWVRGTVVLRYNAKRRLLIRPDGVYKLPATLGRLMMKRSSLESKKTMH
jgi:hypothetical protein